MKWWVIASIAQDDKAPIGCPTEYLTSFHDCFLESPSLSKYGRPTNKLLQALPKFSPKRELSMSCCNLIGNLSVAADKS